VLFGVNIELTVYSLLSCFSVLPCCVKDLERGREGRREQSREGKDSGREEGKEGDLVSSERSRQFVVEVISGRCW